MAFGFLKGARVDVSIEIERPAGPYYPGDVVRGSVVIDSQSKVGIREAYASLVLWEKCKYRTEDSEGDTVVSTATSEEMAAKQPLLGEMELPSGYHQAFQVELAIPASAAPPYAGKIIESKWFAKITIDRPMAKDFNAEAEVHVIVPPTGRTHGKSVSELPHYWDEADLQIELPRLEWVEGETIEGSLSVIPKKNLKFREARIELERREHVPRDEGNTHTVTEAKVQLTSKPAFTAGQSYTLPFAFVVPRQGCPTRRTGHSSVTWTVKGILSRMLGRDFVVAEEISVHNGPARQ